MNENSVFEIMPNGVNDNTESCCPLRRPLSKYFAQPHELFQWKN